jgi:Phage terminase, small subunit
MGERSPTSKQIVTARRVAVRGNRPKPVADKRIRGNPGNRALTTIVPAPKGGAIICPVHVAANETAKAYWDMYLGNAAPGHLAPMDAPLLARLCMSLARVDEAERLMGANMLVKAPNTGLPIQSPYLAIINRQTEIARKLASELALPPAQRNRLGIHDGDGVTDDPAEKYFTD